MAQLRDSKTSTLIAEGTPLQMASLASKVGFDEVLFDDVGLAFDPQAVLDAHAENLANATGDAAADAEAQAKLERGAIKAAAAAIAEARAPLDQG